MYSSGAVETPDIRNAFIDSLRAITLVGGRLWLGEFQRQVKEQAAWLIDSAKSARVVAGEDRNWDTCVRRCQPVRNIAYGVGCGVLPKHHAEAG